MARKIFISHASADKPLADLFVQLLEGGVGIVHSQVFCASLEGQEIPPGVDFKAYIRDELADAEVAIALISENYYASAFCMCELGAIWSQAKSLIPIVVPPLTVNDLKAVLSGVQSLKIGEESHLGTLRDILSKFTLEPTPTPRWNKRSKDFLTPLPTILNALPKPKVISASEAAKLKGERDEYKKEYDNSDEQVSKLTKTIRELSQLKDRQKAAAIILKNSSESQAFERLVRSAQTALAPLPRVVTEALFYEYRGGEDFRPTYDQWEDAPKDAEERGFLIFDDGNNTFSVNESNPKIKRAQQALSALRRFVEETSSAFDQAYEQEHDENLDFQSRGFWERHFW
jgi:hypothetical protein